MRKKLRLLHCLLLLIGAIVSGNTYAQMKTVTGKIADKSGNPIPAASVQIKGKHIGTTSDDKGNFTIHTKIGDVLVVSAVNFVQEEVTIGENTNYNVVLANNDATLNEIVVTALGIKRDKKLLNYSSAV